jgi:hypothetical protein
MRNCNARTCPECVWRACSVWSDDTAPERLAGLAKLPNLRDKKFIAHVNVGPACGKMKPQPKDHQHISFWMLKSFAPEKAVTAVDSL